MLAHHGLGDGQPESRTLGPAGHQWEKDLLEKPLGNPGPVILDVDANDEPMQFGRNGELTLDACAQADSTTRYERLHGVAGDVENRLDE